MKALKLTLLVVILGFCVAVHAQTVPANTHPAAADVHPAAGDPHPAKGDPHPAASSDIHPAYPGYTPETTSAFIVPPLTSGTNTVAAATPAPAEQTFSVPTFVATPTATEPTTTASTTSTNSIGQ